MRAWNGTLASVWNMRRSKRRKRRGSAVSRNMRCSTWRGDSAVGGGAGQKEWPRGGRTRGHSGGCRALDCALGLRPDAQQSSSCEHAVGHEDFATPADDDAARLG